MKTLTTRQRDKQVEAVQNATEFTVEGHGTFPIDMLRYDRCWPASSSDSTSISKTVGPDYLEKRQVSLKGLLPPTYERWRSMGWTVLLP